MSSGSTKTSTTAATTTQTPQVPGWISSPYQSFASQIGDLSKTPASSFVTPASANQQQAFARALNGTNSPGAASGADTYQSNPVVAGQLATTDLSPYMDPYANDVINTTVGDWQHGNELALNSLRASTPTGAFNGSRQGVAEGQLIGDNARTLASTLAGLRSANFAQAQGAATQDINNRLNADQYNEGQRLNAVQTRLAGNTADSANARADTQLMADTGATQRGIAQDTNPAVAQLSLLQSIGSLLGQIPTGTFTGQTQQQNSKTKEKSNPGALDWLSTLANIASMASGIPGNPFASTKGK